MQKSRVCTDPAAPEGKCGVYPVPEARSSKTFYFLPCRRAEDNCDKTLPSLMLLHFNVAMTKKTAKPRAALKRMENP